MLSSGPTRALWHVELVTRCVITLESLRRAMPDTRIIKRYANRKLYDTEHSRYVTLDQISEMIRNGDDVKIVDNKTKEDLTSVTLAQIIFEEDKKRSLAALREWVDHSKHRLEEWQKEVDGKIRGAIETVQHSINPWAGVQKDVRTLADRIAELESKLSELEQHENK